MLILIFFAFLAGIVTILSPCILPVLPIILASSATSSGKSRPYGIIFGFVLSFSFFTLFLSTIVKLLGIPSDILRNISIIVVGLFGLSLLLPSFQLLAEKLFSRLASSRNLNNNSRQGFGGGVMIGLSLGLLWTPCVGPILASVISLAITGSVNGQAMLITLSYALGTAIPMYLVILGGQRLFTRVPFLLANTALIQKAFGMIMIITAIGLYLGLDRSFQTYILNQFPSYGTGLTKFENNAQVANNKLALSQPKLINAELAKTAPELILGGSWINLPASDQKPLELKNLRGKVVLIDFWTYTCINCQRTLPYLTNWYQKYHDQGLTIIGVHSPEFEFEKDLANVKRAVTDFGIEYPVMQDNNFATWQSYNNHYWPAKYLIDANGLVRYTHFGEGDYDQTELAIQSLLKEIGNNVDSSLSNPTTETYATTPETYLGSARDTSPSYLKLSGHWDQSTEYNAPSAGSSLSLNFDAKNVYLVMRPKENFAIVSVYLDGVYQQDITVDQDQLYTILNLNSPGRHQLMLKFNDNNAELFAFTFG